MKTACAMPLGFQAIGVSQAIGVLACKYVSSDDRFRVSGHRQVPRIGNSTYHRFMSTAPETFMLARPS